MALESLKSLQKCVLILGMHRSGTSCLAGSLQNRGLYLGEVQLSNPHNKKGNRENQEIVDLNSAILAFNNSDWDAPPHSKLVWSPEHVENLNKIISKYMHSSHGIWGFKDPRTLLTLDFWRDQIECAELVGTIRHPLLVAGSLQSRNGFEMKKGLNLWLVYNKCLLKALRKERFPIISFCGNKREYLNKIHLLSKKLNLKVNENHVNNFYDDLLVNQVQSGGGEIPQEINEVYEEILSYAV